MKAVISLMFFFILISISAFAEDLSINQLKSIINSESSKNIRKELEDYPFYKNAILESKATSLINKKTHMSKATVQSKYVAKKYVVSIADFTDRKFYTVVGWDDDKKCYKQWSITSKDQVGILYGNRKANTFHWKGKLYNGLDLKSTSTIMKEKVNFQGIIYSPTGGKIIKDEGSLTKAETKTPRKY